MLMELIIRGITIGLVYALMGVGLALLNGVMRIINFAHGEFYMIGGYMAYYSMTLLGLPFYIAVPLAIAITFVLGAVVEKLLLSPIHTQEIEKPMDYALIMTFALLLFLRQLAIKVFGPFHHKPPDYIPFDVNVLGVKISGNEVLAGIVSALLGTRPGPVHQKVMAGTRLEGHHPVPQGRQNKRCRHRQRKLDFLWSGMCSGRGSRRPGCPNFYVIAHYRRFSAG